MVFYLYRFVIDGNKVFIQKEDPEQKLETYTFEQNEVYSVDICFSTGEGKPKEKEARTTIFKRAIDNNYRCVSCTRDKRYPWGRHISISICPD